MGARKLKYELMPNREGFWFWRLRGGNGKIECFSEAFSDRGKPSLTNRRKSFAGALRAARRQQDRLAAGIVSEIVVCEIDGTPVPAGWSSKQIA